MKLTTIYKLISEGNIHINFGVFYNLLRAPEVKKKIIDTSTEKIPELLHQLILKNFGLDIDFQFANQMFDSDTGKMVAAKPKYNSPLIGGYYSPSRDRTLLTLTKNEFKDLIKNNYNQFIHTLIYIITHELVHKRQYQQNKQKPKINYYNADGSVNLGKYFTDEHELMAYAITANINLFNAHITQKQFDNFLNNPGPSSLVYKSSYVIRNYYKYFYLTKKLKIWDRFKKYLIKYFDKLNYEKFRNSKINN